MNKIIIIFLLLTGCTTVSGKIYTHEPTIIYYEKADIKVEDGMIHIKDAEDVIIYTESVQAISIDRIYNLKDKE